MAEHLGRSVVQLVETTLAGHAAAGAATQSAAPAGVCDVRSSGCVSR